MSNFYQTIRHFLVDSLIVAGTVCIVVLTKNTVSVLNTVNTASLPKLNGICDNANGIMGDFKKESLPKLNEICDNANGIMGDFKKESLPKLNGIMGDFKEESLPKLNRIMGNASETNADDPNFTCLLHNVNKTLDELNGIIANFKKANTTLANQVQGSPDVRGKTSEEIAEMQSAQPSIFQRMVSHLPFTGSSDKNKDA